jgi:signal transduction histidine kinase
MSLRTTHLRNESVSAAEGRRAGHSGLTGMRERAARIEGSLSVWSEADAGTEIEPAVPGAIAYGRRKIRG